MSINRTFPMIATFALVSTLTVNAQSAPMVRIESAGKPCASAGPRKAPPRSDGRIAIHAECGLSSKDIRDKDGQVISSIGVYVWKDGELTRVRIYTLVPAPGAPNRWLNEADDDEKLKQPKFLIDYTIAPGEAKPIAEMRAWGIEPMTLRYSGGSQSSITP